MNFFFSRLDKYKIFPIHTIALFISSLISKKITIFIFFLQKLIFVSCFMFVEYFCGTFGLTDLFKANFLNRSLENNMKLQKLIKSTGREVLYNNSFLRNIYINNRFSSERMLLNGKHEGNKDRESILVFTLHKCASVYVSKILQKLYKDTDITSINLEAYLALSELPSPHTIHTLDDKIFKEKIKNSFKPLGYLYAVLRDPKLLELIDNILDYRTLLVLRDPREVLVSAYFSFGYTHASPIVKSKREEFLAWRNTIVSQTVDEYVLATKDVWREKYTYYCQKLLRQPNVLFMKYEDMVSDFDNWLNTIIEFLKIDPDRKKLNKIINKAKQKQVNPLARKRKLKPETIDILNSEFREVLDLLGYQ